MSEQAAPGWYPVDERTERWWDGQQWSEHQRAKEQAPPPTGVPAAPYPYGGDAIQRPQAPMQSQGYDPTPTYSQPDGQGPPDPFERQPQYFGQQPPYGRAPGYAEPAPTRSAGRTIAAVLVALLGVLFTLAGLSNIASNSDDGARGIGYVIGSLLIPGALWTGFYFLVRRPRA